MKNNNVKEIPELYWLLGGESMSWDNIPSSFIGDCWDEIDNIYKTYSSTYNNLKLGFDFDCEDWPKIGLKPYIDEWLNKNSTNNKNYPWQIELFGWGSGGTNLQLMDLLKSYGIPNNVPKGLQHINAMVSAPLSGISCKKLHDTTIQQLNKAITAKNTTELAVITQEIIPYAPIVGLFYYILGAYTPSTKIPGDLLTVAMYAAGGFTDICTKGTTNGEYLLYAVLQILNFMRTDEFYNNIRKNPLFTDYKKPSGIMFWAIGGQSGKACISNMKGMEDGYSFYIENKKPSSWTC